MCLIVRVMEGRMAITQGSVPIRVEQEEGFGECLYKIQVCILFFFEREVKRR